MVDINSSLIIQIINFIVLILVLDKIFYKPVRKILLERKEKVDGLERSINEASQGAAEKAKSFDDGIKNARMKGVKKKELFIEEATAEEKKIVAGINEKVQGEIEEMRKKIAKEADGVRKSLTREIDAFAKDIGKKILGRAV